MKRTNHGFKATSKTRASLRREKQFGLLALKGEVRWTGSLDAMRQSRFPAA
jgi:hypothetical protein